MTNVIAVFVILSTLSLVACDRPTEEFPGPNQTPGAVLKTATEHMTAKGTIMANYELDGLTFDYVDRRWFVSFYGKSLAIGDHFTVYVSDENVRNVEVVPGL